MTRRPADALAAAYRTVLRLTETIHDPYTTEGVRREASARRLVIARRHCIGIVHFPPRRRGQEPLEPEQFLPNAGQLLIPHCARRADPVPEPELTALEELMRVLPPRDVTPPEVVYVACGRPLCTTCALAEA